MPVLECIGVHFFMSNRLLDVLVRPLKLVRANYLAVFQGEIVVVMCRYIYCYGERKLIGHCFIMCGVVDGYEIGLGTKNGVVESIQKVIEAVAPIQTAVVAKLESGQLIVENGEIVRSGQSSDAN